VSFVSSVSRLLKILLPTYADGVALVDAAFLY